MMRIHDWTLTILLGLALVGVGSGCGKSDDKGESQVPAPPPQASVPPPPAASPSAAPAAPPATAAASTAIATTEGETPGTRIELQELKRSSGDSVTLRFSFINDSDNGIPMYAYLNGGDRQRDERTVNAITLVDPVGKKKYFVLKDSEGFCLCSRPVPDMSPKARLNLWAKFPAPPENVQKVSIVIPHFAPLDDVPLGR